VFYVVDYGDSHEIHVGFKKLRPSKRNVFRSDKEVTLDMEILAQWADSQWYPARVIRISKTKPRVSKKNLTVKFWGSSKGRQGSIPFPFPFSLSFSLFPFLFPFFD